MDALVQFEKQDYVKKLKTSITSESMPSGQDDLVEFLYDQVVHIQMWPNSMYFANNLYAVSESMLTFRDQFPGMDIQNNAIPIHIALSYTFLCFHNVSPVMVAFVSSCFHSLSLTQVT